MRWIVTVIVIVIVILTIIYYAHDPYSKLRKTFKRNKSPPVQYKKYKHSFLIFGPFNTINTTFKKSMLNRIYPIESVRCLESNVDSIDASDCFNECVSNNH